MKNKLHRSFVFILLIGFIYVQVPFALFHHHEHKPICELNEGAALNKASHQSQTHFHENKNTPCFFCSAQLIKEYNVKDFSFSFVSVNIETAYYFPEWKLINNPVSFFSSRAPPALA